jgi:hypothetical protein
MGKAFVDGLQTKGLTGGERSGAATCKHFAAFATPENGLCVLYYLLELRTLTCLSILLPSLLLFQ